MEPMETALACAADRHSPSRSAGERHSRGLTAAPTRERVERTVAHRRAADGRIFRVALVASIGVHAAVLLLAALPVSPPQSHTSRAPLQAVETAMLTAVPLPEPQRRPPQATPSVNAIPVPSPRVVAEPPVETVAAPVAVTLPPPVVRADSAVREAPPALAGSVAHGQYEQEVARWVERQRDYPLTARRRGLEGTAIVRLRLGANGALLAAQIVRDTGHSVLDRAALGMIERAAPYPGVPSALGSAAVEVLVPIQFSLGR